MSGFFEELLKTLNSGEFPIKHVERGRSSRGISWGHYKWRLALYWPDTGWAIFSCYIPRASSVAAQYYSRISK